MNKKNAKIAWITDTTSTLSQEYIEYHHIHVVPLQVIINQQSYKETVDITAQTFYERMEMKEGSFQTSLPSLGEFINLYESLKKEYDYGIAFHCSSELSGTFSTSVMGAKEAGFKLIAIDTKSGSYPHSFLIKKGIELIEQGFSVDEMVEQIEELIGRTRLFLIPSNLNQLHKSGRVSGSQRLIANLLNIKPILSIEPDGAKICEKVRTDKKAFGWIIDQIKEDRNKYKINKIVIVHANAVHNAERLQQTIHNTFPGIATELMILIPVAGVHTGVGTLGLSWVCE